MFVKGTEQSLTQSNHSIKTRYSVVIIDFVIFIITIIITTTIINTFFFFLIIIPGLYCKGFPDSKTLRYKSTSGVSILLED